MAYKDRTIELTHLDKSTFQDKIPNGRRMSQKALETLYIKLRNEWPGDWESFKAKYGILLGVDDSGEWGKGAHFKIRFVEGQTNGKPNGIFRKTIQVAKDAQVREWRVDFLTKGSPGTRLSLADTAKKFLDPESWYQKQLHHLEGIAEDAPYIDPTIKKILPGANKTTIKYKQGQNEYKSFRRHAHRNNLIYGDKYENLIALRKPDHVPVKDPSTNKNPKLRKAYRGSVHFEGGREGTNVVGKTSGHPDFSPKTYEIINKHPAIESKRLGIGGQYSNGKVLSRWDLLAQKRALYQEGKLANIQTALNIHNPEDRPFKKQPFKKQHPKVNWIKTQAAKLGKPEAEIEALYNKIDDGSIIENWANSTAKWRAKELKWKSGGQAFSVDPIGAAVYGAGKLIKENVTGAVTGLAYLPLDPKFQQAVEKGSAKDMASAVAQDVLWGAGISQAMKEGVNLGMRKAPATTAKVVSTVAPHLAKVAPVLLAASAAGSTPQNKRGVRLGYKSEEEYLAKMAEAGIDDPYETPKPFINKLWEDIFAPRLWKTR